MQTVPRTTAVPEPGRRRQHTVLRYKKSLPGILDSKMNLCLCWYKYGSNEARIGSSNPIILIKIALTVWHKNQTVPIAPRVVGHLQTQLMLPQALSMEFRNQMKWHHV